MNVDEFTVTDCMHSLIFPDTRNDSQYESKEFVTDEEIEALVRRGMFSCYIETSSKTRHGLELLVANAVSIFSHTMSYSN